MAGIEVVIFLYAFEGSNVIRCHLDIAEVTWLSSSVIHMRLQVARYDAEE